MYLKLINNINIMYTLDTFNSVKIDNYDNILKKETEDAINTLISIFGLNDNNKTKKVEKYKKKIDSNWNQVRDFKPTKLPEVLNNKDKLLNSIRISLNKISNKNLDLFKLEIEKYIDSILIDENNNEENETLISNIIIEISSTNKFFSILYATLFKDLIKKYPFLTLHLNKYIEKYKEKLNNIVYVEPDINYNEYCNYNKSNDKNKSTSLFIVNLVKLNIIDFTVIEDIIINIQEKINFLSKEQNKSNEIEELIENIYILITSGVAKSINKTWSTLIIDSINNLSNINKNNNDIHSISSRAKFRCKDIIEFLQK